MGRGTADNKAQHAINLAALAQVMALKDGRLNFNVKMLFDMGEEIGSPGLREFCGERADRLAADLLIASDGPRITAERPTVFVGSRGVYSFRLEVELRNQAYHSGNWGGLLRNPATVLAAAIASLVDGSGRIALDGLRPPAIPDNVRAALAVVKIGGGDGDPEIDSSWGEPALTPEERVFAWNTLEVLSLRSGDQDAPGNAIPCRADATLQLRFVVGTDWPNVADVVRAHLDRYGFPMVNVRPASMKTLVATRLDLDNPWVGWAADSIRRTTGKDPALLPNFAGSLPNDVFSDVLGMATLWVPHSYPSCAQHAPDEHVLGSVCREGLMMMAGLFWDLGEEGAAIADAARTFVGRATPSSILDTDSVPRSGLDAPRRPMEADHG